MDIVERPVRGLFLGSLRERRGVPPTSKLFDRRHVDGSIVQVVLEVGHVLGEETPVRADRTTTEGDAALVRYVPFDVGQNLRSSGRDVDIARFDRVEQTRTGMHARHDIVHLSELIGIRVDDDVDAVVERFEIGVGDQRSDLNDHMAIWFQAGHFEVKPCEAVIHHRCGPYQAPWTFSRLEKLL